MAGMAFNKLAKEKPRVTRKHILTSTQVSKLREITASLLNCKVDRSYRDKEGEEQVQSCINRLIATLVELDDIKKIHEE